MSSLELFKERGEPFKYKVRMPTRLAFLRQAEEPQMDMLRNGLAGRPADVSLLAEHPFSTAASGESRHMEAVTV